MHFNKLAHKYNSNLNRKNLIYNINMENQTAPKIWEEYTGRKCWNIKWILQEEIKIDKKVIQQLLLKGYEIFCSFFSLFGDKYNIKLYYGSGQNFDTGFRIEIILKEPKKSEELNSLLTSCGLYDCKLWSKFKVLNQEERWMITDEGQKFATKLPDIIFPFVKEKCSMKLYEMYNTILKRNYNDPDKFIQQYKNKQLLYHGDFINNKSVEEIIQEHNNKKEIGGKKILRKMNLLKILTRNKK